MNETNIILKSFPNKRNTANRIVSVIANVKLNKPIYGARFFELTFYHTTNYSSVNTLLRCDLVDKSRNFSYGNDSNDKKVVPTDVFQVSNYGNFFARKTKISYSKNTINEFEVEAEFSAGELFSEAESKNSYFQITIYHTEE